MQEFQNQRFMSVAGTTVLFIVKRLLMSEAMSDNREE